MRATALVAIGLALCAPVASQVTGWSPKQLQELRAIAGDIASAQTSVDEATKDLAEATASLIASQRRLAAFVEKYAKPIPPDPPEPPIERDWEWPFQRGEERGELHVALSASDYGGNIADTMNASIDAARSVGDHGDVEVYILLDDGVHRGYSVQRSWQGRKGRVNPAAFEAKSITLIARRPPEFGGEHGEIGSYRCATWISPERTISGGDTVYINEARPGSHLRMWGVGERMAGRSALTISTGRDFLLTQRWHNVEIEPLADPKSIKWGYQLYMVTDVWQDASASFDGGQEHIRYKHGFGDPKYGDSVRRRIWYRNCPGQHEQHTFRQSETTYRAPQRLIVEDCIFQNWGQSAGRAGSCFTLAGSGVECEIRRTVFVDDIPDDTRGDQGWNKENTNYGAITVWTPGGNPPQSWAEFNGGYGNVSLTLDDVVFAVRRNNRSLAKYRDLQELQVSRTAHLLADPRGDRFARISDPDGGQRPVQLALYQGSSAPSPEMVELAMSLLEPGGDPQDYQRIEVLVWDENAQVRTEPPTADFIQEGRPLPVK